MRTTPTLLLCSATCLSLACVSPGGPAGYAPPAWSEPGLEPFLYGLTRKAITKARGPYPRLVVRRSSEEAPAPSLLWAQVPGAISKQRSWERLPFLPIPNLRIPLPAELTSCPDFELFVNPTEAEASPLDARHDAIAAPLARERLAPEPGSECAVVVFYGTWPERKGAWLQAASSEGVFFEQLIVEPRPAFWAVVPFAAIGETAYNAAVTFVVLLAIGGMGAGGAGGH